MLRDRIEENINVDKTQYLNEQKVSKEEITFVKYVVGLKELVMMEPDKVENQFGDSKGDVINDTLKKIIKSLAKIDEFGDE